MRRKATKNTRGPNATEKAFQGWLKEQPCAYCGASGPSIVDHARGSTFKHNRVLIGHLLCTSKCQTCDSYKTSGSHNKHFEMLGEVESDACIRQIYLWSRATDMLPPREVFDSICDFADKERMRYSA